MYYNDGKLRLEGKILNNKKEGVFKTYYSSGKLYIFGAYKNNFKEGVWIEYDENSKVLLKETYQNGVLLKSENFKPKEENDKKW